MKSSYLKGAFIFAAILGAIALFFFTQDTVHKIRESQRRSIDLWVKALERVVNASSSETSDLSFIYNEIVTRIDFPAIMTTAENVPVTWKNIEIDSTLSDSARTAFLNGLMTEMDKQYPPLEVTLGDSITLQRVHYGDSKLVRALQVVPLVSAIGVALFLWLAYLSFKYIKRSEESNIWVGMAKETAHQLGTPISSLMGWIELLRSTNDNPERQTQIVFDMQVDVNRLTRVATRFSKIGSKEELTPHNVAEVVESVFNYYRRRIPNMGKKNVELVALEAPDVMVKMNRELMEWVFENITKNAIDSIERGPGKITAQIIDDGKFVLIDITDTGKGVPAKNRKDIFRPGYSTKSRGWGLGLSLAKRIVEDYHKGKLILKESAVGKGSTFRIKLHKQTQAA
ncbi:MAG: HAMP domain-containing histidine kinase [Chlorobiales bacterium]|jgi:K+-sensing histidine kinase KdpD|nr:HAMP domain-containing histidine kinase [Chlorobiales bacterium]